MSKVVQDHFPRTISQYVPAMEFAADVVGDVAIVNLGAPAAPDADGIWDGVSATDSATSYTSANYKNTFDGSSTSLTSTSGMIDATYGRALTATGSAGSNHVCTISGRDYLGQPMKENLTLNGTNVIAGKKAFKYVDKLEVAAGAASDTVDVGWGDVLGLPYAAEATLSATEDGVATSPTFVKNVTTDPQTATTGDPRGTYDPASACDGSIVHEVRYIADTGNLHGVAHFNG
mgnify:FL=1|tara:strand:- start:22 stop:717 length:696 start_codon:yes stop_codon:yes gene_type:complete